MRERILILILMVVISCAVVGCNPWADDGNLENVGLILEGTIHDETWGHSAYLGMLDIKEEFNVSILFEENVTELEQVERIVSDFNRQGVNLIFGQGENFGRFFDEISEFYPKIQFVYFNGNTFSNNITSVQFDNYDLYFFAGMLSAEMTTTNRVGVLSPYASTSSLEGFFDGVRSVNPNIDIHYQSIKSGYDQQQAIKVYNEMVETGIDVIFPAGEGFNTPIIHQAKEDDISVIGYINDQYKLAQNHVITSTVIETEEIYPQIAQMVDDETFASGIMNLGFMSPHIHLGNYGDHVPPSVREWLDQQIESYLETGERINR